MIKVNAQEWLESQEKYNTKEKRNETTKLDISNKNLEKKLNLSDFVNLEELNCSYNELTSLDISKCSKLVKLNCSYNLLDNLEFLDKCSERLLFLSLENCCSKTFFREEIKEKTKRFKNLVPLDL
jgi:Leucine-rich repeat (LRR) protein